MSEKNPDHGPEIVKWYTRARKFPQLIGRTPDGAKLWGGPYTITQAVGAGVVLFIGINTMSLWAQFGFIGNIVALLVVAYGIVFGLGRIPVGSRNPVAVVTGAYRAVAAPKLGRLGGRPVRLRRPHRLRHQVLIGRPVSSRATIPIPGAVTATSPDPAAVPSEAPPAHEPADQLPSPVSAPAGTRQPALTAVQALLADATFDRSDNR